MTGREFGHNATIILGVACFDAWGSGPFIIEAEGKTFRFGDSDRFGPYLCDRLGDPVATPYPPERSPFWRAHRIWKRQGRKVAADGVTCLWAEPKPDKGFRIGRRSFFLVEDGEEDGEFIEVPRPATPPPDGEG